MARKTPTTPTELNTQSINLQGSMGVGALVMSVLAFASPLATVAGTMPVLLMFSGSTAPGIYIIMTVMLLIFSVGFVRMSSTLDNPGGFYSFVTAGLGKPAGLGGAFLALVGYAFIGFFAPPFFAVTMQELVGGRFGGPDIPWPVYAIALIAVTTFLAYRRIDLSAKVLTFVMLLEVLIVIIFNVASFATTGARDHDSIAFAMPWFGDAAIGLALLFAIGNFFGFEATVIFRDEVKDPKRTIPRATYLSVAGIGLFYTIAAWGYLAFLGAENARGAATDDTVGLFGNSIGQLLGPIFSDITAVLLITSVLASMLSIQNIAARYGFSLARDGALPRGLGAVHPAHRSPYRSALAIGIFWTAATLLFTAIGVAPEALYAIASGSGTFNVLLLMFIASAAVLVYFLRRRRTVPDSIVRTILAPLVSLLFLGVVTYLAIANYPELIGGSIVLTVIFMTFTFVLFAGGFVYAFVLRRRRPDVYARLGRQRP